MHGGEVYCIWYIPGRGAGTGWSLKSLPAQTIWLFYACVYFLGKKHLPVFSFLILWESYHSIRRRRKKKSLEVVFELILHLEIGSICLPCCFWKQVINPCLVGKLKLEFIILFEVLVIWIILCPKLLSLRVRMHISVHLSLQWCDWGDLCILFIFQSEWNYLEVFRGVRV